MGADEARRRRGARRCRAAELIAAVTAITTNVSHRRHPPAPNNLGVMIGPAMTATSEGIARAVRAAPTSGDATNAIVNAIRATSVMR